MAEAALKFVADARDGLWPRNPLIAAVVWQLPGTCLQSPLVPGPIELRQQRLEALALIVPTAAPTVSLTSCMAEPAPIHKER